LVAASPEGSDQASPFDRDHEIVAHLPDGIAVLDQHGAIEWANDRFAAWCSSAPAGCDFCAALDLPADEMASFRAALAAGRPAFATLQTTGNRFYDVRASAVFPAGAADSPSRTVVAVRDVTDAMLEQQKRAAIHAAGHDIYVADFEHLGVYACRIVVPGMSEIYPVDDLEWENNSVANDIREDILHLADLDDDECGDLLDTLNENGVADARLVAALIGVAAGDDAFWKDLRVGELKILLALAIGDEDAIIEGCDWVRNFEEIDADRRRTYRCVESGDGALYGVAMESLYGAETLRLALALLDGELRFFGEPSLGLQLSDCDTHQSLLAAYGKLHRSTLNA